MRSSCIEHKEKGSYERKMARHSQGLEGSGPVCYRWPKEATKEGKPRNRTNKTKSQSKKTEIVNGRAYQQLSRWRHLHASGRNDTRHTVWAGRFRQAGPVPSKGWSGDPDGEERMQDGSGRWRAGTMQTTTYYRIARCARPPGGWRNQAEGQSILVLTRLLHLSGPTTN